MSEPAPVADEWMDRAIRAEREVRSLRANLHAAETKLAEERDVSALLRKTLAESESDRNPRVLAAIRDAEHRERVVNERLRQASEREWKLRDELNRAKHLLLRPKNDDEPKPLPEPAPAAETSLAVVPKKRWWQE